MRSLIASVVVALAMGFVPMHAPLRAASRAPASGGLKMAFDMEASVAESKEMRLKHLEEQAMFALKLAVENHENPVFPNAMIAGDCVITHLLDRLGYLKNGKVKIMVVDTFHLFDETTTFLKDIESHYGFKAEVFQPEGCADKSVYDERFGADLWKVDIEQYDKVCKVEPFQRGLKTLNTDCMINGRTRWQGFERAYIDLFENAPIGGGLAKGNPLAYWTFEDTFDYIAKYKVPAHPLHAKGYPSLGDAKDTIPIPSMDEKNPNPEEGFTAFQDFKWVGDMTKWCDYASERKGRFVGLINKDGSTKTECGIHVAGAEKTFDRDLWEGGKVATLDRDGALALKAGGGTPTLMVVYAPWCQFCQGMEEEFEKLAGEVSGVSLAKYRGDEERDFVSSEFGVQSFPTIAFIGADGKVKKYESEARDVASLKAFAMSN